MPLEGYSSPVVFFEQINDAFFELDKDWNFAYLNHAGEKLLNRNREDLLGQNIWKEFPEAVGSSFYTNYHHAIEQKREILFEEYYPPLSTWFFVKAYPTESDGLWVFFSNINEFKETQIRLKESERNFRSLFENMTLGVVYQDEQKKIISANPAAQEILGLSLDEMMGRIPADPRWKAMDEHGYHLPPEMHPAVQALDTRRPVIAFRMQIFNPRINQHRWLLVDSVPEFRNGVIEPFQVFSLFRDITESQKALSDREEMMHVITHDLRSPIRSAQALLSMIQNDIEQKMPEVRQEIQHLNKALQRAVELTNGFVDSANLEQVNALPIHLAPVLEDLAGTQSTLVRESGLDWELDVHEPETIIAAIDPPRLKQVLENLIGNAIKFTDAPGLITLKAYPDSENVILEVKDSGRGITDNEQEKIFKKFWQPDRKHKGAGLGLYIVKRIVDAHRGRIEVRSKLGQGTTFTVRLPRTLS